MKNQTIEKVVSVKVSEPINVDFNIMFIDSKISEIAAKLGEIHKNYNYYVQKSSEIYEIWINTPFDKDNHFRLVKTCGMFEALNYLNERLESEVNREVICAQI